MVDDARGRGFESEDVMKALPAYWKPLNDLIASYIFNRVDYWTLQASGGSYAVPPYVQALLEHDNMILIEAVSNKFLVPKLTNQAHQALLFMGWRFFPGNHYPNYSQILDLGKVTPQEIAITMVNALHFAYGVNDTFLFEMAPALAAEGIVITTQGQSLRGKS
jgi:hypothetical protein